MPNKPLRPCAKPGCRNLTRSGYCEEHAHLQARQEPEQRLSAHQRGYTYRYSKVRRSFLAAHPWCVECAKQGHREPATELDHIIPHKGDMVLFWDQNNWQGLCKMHHSQKTAKEDGGFGNPLRRG